MKSYKLYQVSEFLKDRHPYIPKEEDNYIDPQEVSTAYNERMIPKLTELLLDETLPKEKKYDTLYTLNQLVSVQETKAEMISNEIVLIATNLIADDYEKVRSEACRLVGSLLFLSEGRNQFNLRPTNYTIINNILFDKSINVRYNCKK